MKLSGLVQRISRKTGEQDLNFNEFGHQRVDAYLPDYTQMAKQRRIFGASTGAGTAIAPVTAIPTTAAAWALFNPEEPGGPSYAILQVGCYSVSGTLGLGMSLLGTVAQAPVTGTKPAAYASSVMANLTGSKKLPAAILAQAVTLVDTAAWVVLASRDQVSAVSVGSGLVADVKGMLIVPPQHVAGFTILAPVGTTALFGVSIVAAELDLDIE